MTTKTITSEELWEKVDYEQGWLDALREYPQEVAEKLRREAAETFAEALTIICVVSGRFGDW